MTVSLEMSCTGYTQYCEFQGHSQWHTGILFATARRITL